MNNSKSSPICNTISMPAKTLYSSLWTVWYYGGDKRYRLISSVLAAFAAGQSRPDWGLAGCESNNAVLVGAALCLWVKPFDQVERNRTEAGRNTLGHDLIERLVFHYGIYEFVDTISWNKSTVIWLPNRLFQSKMQWASKTSLSGRSPFCNNIKSIPLTGT